MRIVILTHYYPPEVGAPQGRLEALGRGLARAGAEVVVHTCAPHYPDGVVRPGYRNRLSMRAAANGAGGVRDADVGGRGRPDTDRVRVLRSFVLPAANRGVGARLLDHASFAASSLLTGRAAGAADVVIVESPPLFLAAAAPSYARRRGARLILHVSDLWPDSVVELGAVTSPAAIRAARALERYAYRHADRIVAPTAGIVRRLEQRPDLASRRARSSASAPPAAKLRRIPPAVDAERFRAPPVVREGPLRVLYAGTVGMAQGVGTLVEAARRVGPDVQLTVAGAGAELDEVRRMAESAPNVSVLGAVAAEAVPGLYAEADAAAVLLRDRPLFDDALPTKTFEAMAAGRPLVLAARGEAADLVEAAGAGIVVAPEDVDELAHALATLAATPEPELRAIGVRGVACARRFDRRSTIDRWLGLLEEVSGRRPGRNG